jgi:hypothetical protein
LHESAAGEAIVQAANGNAPSESSKNVIHFRMMTLLKEKLTTERTENTEGKSAKSAKPAVFLFALVRHSASY